MQLAAVQRFSHDPLDPSLRVATAMPVPSSAAADSPLHTAGTNGVPAAHPEATSDRHGYTIREQGPVGGSKAEQQQGQSETAEGKEAKASAQSSRGSCGGSTWGSGFKNYEAETLLRLSKVCACMLCLLQHAGRQYCPIHSVLSPFVNSCLSSLVAVVVAHHQLAWLTASIHPSASA